MTEIFDIQEFLRRHEPFSTLAQRSLNLLAENIRITYHRCGEVLQPAQRLYLIRSGAAELRSADQRLLEQIGEGECFGRADLLHHHACDLAITSEDSLIYQIDSGLFEKLCEIEKGFRRYFKIPHDSRIRLALANRADSLSLTTEVASLCKREPVTISPQASVQDAARLMNQQKVSSLLVVDREHLLGIITDSDMRRRVVAEGASASTTVASAMTASPLTVHSESFVFEALLLMTRHNIHHLPVMANNGVSGLITSNDLVRTQRSQPVLLISEIWKAADTDQLAAVAAEIPTLFTRLVEADGRARDVSRILTALSDAITLRLINLAENALGPAPVPYAWLGFGSQGREEQNISSDQDNALLLDNSFDTETHGDYYKQLADFVCDGLNRCGYVHCPGNVMAKNPQWRLSEKQWLKQFACWIEEPDASAVMHSSIFFDMRVICGEKSLAESLRDLIKTRAPENSIFLAFMAKNSLTHQPPLGFFRNLVLERESQHKDELDLKHKGAICITDLARLHALASGIASVNTSDRLRDLADTGVLNRKDVRNLLDANEFINNVRLQNQITELRLGQKPDNFVAPKNLSSLQRNHLKDAFKIIKRGQESLRQRFLQGMN